MSRVTASLHGWFSVSLLGLFHAVSTDTPGTSLVKVLAAEGDSVMLPCSMITKEDLRGELFDWVKDRELKSRQEVFLYAGGSHNGNGRTGQDPQYKGRVSHFWDQLQYGNASILIGDTRIDDSGIYTCVFPHLAPERKFHIHLVVEPIPRNRHPLTTGTAPRPYVGLRDVTGDGVLLHCEVRGAHPQPELQWLTADGSVVPAEEPQVSERGGRYDVALIATVTKSGNFCCEVKQKELYHVIHECITVQEKLFVSSTGIGLFIGVWFSGFVIGAVVVALIGWVFIVKRRKNGSRRQQKSSEEEDEEKTGLSTHPLEVNGSAVNHAKTPNAGERAEDTDN